MGDERWSVEITVGGFGPDHPLWAKFAKQAAEHADPKLEWTLPPLTDRTGQAARIRAVVEADSAEAAIRLLMRIVRQAGRSVDRYDEVTWAGMEGAAFRIQREGFDQ